jgi:hypothetical protein
MLRLGLFNSVQHRIHASVATLVDMDIMAAAVNTDAMGGIAMHITTRTTRIERSREAR